MKKGWDLWWLPFAVFFVVCLALAVYIDRSACEDVCEGMNSRCAWEWKRGCWCEDARGFFNPEDERSEEAGDAR